jgi:hypothetical protein
MSGFDCDKLMGMISSLKDDYPIDAGKEEEDIKFRALAKTQGLALVKQWVTARAEGIKKICKMFTEEGKPAESISATTFSDLYKFTMSPIMLYIKNKTNKNCNVTFGIDLRDKTFRDALKTDKALQDEIAEALKDLENRPFKKEVFEHVLSGPRDTIFNIDGDEKEKAANIDLICGPEGSPRMLAYKVHEFGEKPEDNPKELESGNVHIYFYYKDDKTYDAEGTEKGVHFIEAVGPWHLVTWLETSMMQCVYEAKLRYDLKQQGISYTDWLRDALLRCAMSISYSRLVQTAYKRPIPSLFAGRRTGGLLFLMLQNLMFTDCFTSVPNSLAITVEGSSPVPCIGTSSSDVHYTFTKELSLPCVPMVGTNAHEMRMVLSILYAALDVMPKNPSHIPYSQIIGDYLYYKLVWEKLKLAWEKLKLAWEKLPKEPPPPPPPPPPPSPALPDTLGTKTYLQAATTVEFEDGRAMFDLVTSARQDSGELPDFLDAMNEYGYTNSSMASEIDTTVALLKSAKLERTIVSKKTKEPITQKYGLYGAGGFFGESIKVWSKKLGENAANSMAVKAVRVESTFDGSEGEKEVLSRPSLYFKVEGDKIKKIKGYPVKLGDTIEVSKLSVDRNLGSEQIKKMKDYFLKIRGDANAKKDDLPKYKITDLFNKADGTIPTTLFTNEAAAQSAAAGASQGGRGRKNKTKMYKGKRTRKHRTRRVRRKA